MQPPAHTPFWSFDGRTADYSAMSDGAGSRASTPESDDDGDSSRRAPVSLARHYNRTTLARKGNPMKGFYKYFLIPGITNLAGGELCAPDSDGSFSSSLTPIASRTAIQWLLSVRYPRSRCRLCEPICAVAAERTGSYTVSGSYWFILFILAIRKPSHDPKVRGRPAARQAHRCGHNTAVREGNGIGISFRVY